MALDEGVGLGQRAIDLDPLKVDSDEHELAEVVSHVAGRGATVAAVDCDHQRASELSARQLLDVLLLELDGLILRVAQVLVQQGLPNFRDPPAAVQKVWSSLRWMIIRRALGLPM